MRFRLFCPVWKKIAGVCCTVALIAFAFSAPVCAQYGILDGHFNSGGGVRDGTGHRIIDTMGQICCPDESCSGSSMITSGFWFHAWITSTIEVAITSFDCAYCEDAVHLGWTLITDNEFEGIHILRAGAGEVPARITEEPLPTSARSFIDYTALPGRAYDYQLEILEAEGKTTRSITLSTSIPGRMMTLYQNYPNPFNPSTTIMFYISENSFVRLDIFNVKGEKVKTLASTRYDAGTQEVVWNGTDDYGGRVSTGVYFYRLVAGKSTLTRKLVLMRLLFPRTIRILSIPGRRFSISSPRVER